MPGLSMMAMSSGTIFPSCIDSGSSRLFYPRGLLNKDNYFLSSTSPFVEGGALKVFFSLTSFE